MPAQNVALQVEIIPLRIVLAGIAAHECHVIPVGDKADVLAVPFAGIDKAVLICDLPCLGLRQAAEGQERMGELFLGQAVQNVGLVLGCIRRLAEQVASCLGVLTDLGIMSGNDIIAAQLLCPAQKTVEFQVTVALDAGIGGQAGFIAADKVANDLIIEIRCEIENVKWHTQAARHAAGILHIVQGAAGAVLGLTVIKTHGGSHAVISRGLGQQSGGGAVHTTAHGDQCFPLFHSDLLKSLLFWSIATIP